MPLKWKGNYGYIGSLCIATISKPPGLASWQNHYMPVEMGSGIFGMESEEVAREVAERDTLEWLKSKGLQPIPEKPKMYCSFCGEQVNFPHTEADCPYFNQFRSDAIAAERVKLAEGNGK